VARVRHGAGAAQRGQRRLRRAPLLLLAGKEEGGENEEKDDLAEGEGGERRPGRGQEG